MPASVDVAEFYIQDVGIATRYSRGYVSILQGPEKDIREEITAHLAKASKVEISEQIGIQIIQMKHFTREIRYQGEAKS